MAVEIRVEAAQLGDEREADLVCWLVADGTRVEAGQAVAELSTAKVIVQLEAARSGRLRQRASAGDVVTADTVLGEIDDG